MGYQHRSVLLDEAVALLKPGAGRLIIDGTLGGGGHAEAFLERGAAVVGIDRDPEAIAAAAQRLERFEPRFHPLLGNFADVEELARIWLPADGLLLDLGVSSAQLSAKERGFSFQEEGPLDMRMGRDGKTARELIEMMSERELSEILRAYGEERFARAIARELKRALPSTTTQAVEAVKRAVPRRAWPKRIHVATRTFQALRIAVNRELSALDKVLPALPRLLREGGVAAVISFHSLEDRKVKRAFLDLAGRCTCPPLLPACACGARGDFALLTRKPVSPSEDELSQNPRARSAKMRAVERVR